MRKSLCLLALAASILSCSREIEEATPSVSGAQLRTFTASFAPDTPDTRTSFAKDGSTYRHSWTADDQISVFVASSTSNDKYSVTACDGASATFSGTSVSASEGTHYAIYPYSSSNASDGAGHLQLSFPSQQNYASGSFGEEANVMAAATTTDRLRFQNLSAYVRISLTGNGERVKKITFSSNGGVKISGAASISYDDFATLGAPSINMSTTASDQVVLNCPEPVLLGAAPVDFYLATAPATLASGVTLKVQDADGGSMTRSISSQVILERNMVSPTSLAYVPDVRSATFDQNAIVASFGVMSDTHLDRSTSAPATKLANAFAQLKAEASKCDTDGLDGILVAGDLIQTGCNTTEISSWKSTYQAAFDPAATSLVYCLGNHDVTNWWSTRMVTDGQTFRSIFGSAYYTTDQDKTNGEALECRHCVIKGVNVLAISPIGNTPVRYESRAISWLDAKLQELTAENPDQYVILLTHPMIHNTVYGSTLVSAGYLSDDASVASYWYTTSLSSVLKKYPQVITFGGHLHFPINDPCSIWQGDFTAFGCGSTRYMAFEGGSYYVNKYSATTFNDRDEFSQGYLMQVDANGNVRMTRMDFYHGQTIGDLWELRYPDAVGKSHLQAFSNSRRVAENQAPKLTTLEVEQGSTSLSSVPCKAVWAAAQDEDFAHHYELTWTSASGSNTVWIMSDYYLKAKPADMKNTWEYSLGSFPAGSYNVSLVAVDSWGKRSAELSKSFTVETSTTPSDPSTLPSAYVDFAFDGTLRDVNAKVDITNHGASLTTTEVSHGGVSKTVPAFVTTSSSSYARCQFKEITSAESMKYMMLGGFTVEAFYLDKNKSDGQTHGVVCGTEYGGWGLAETTARKPYFIVGDGTGSNTYRSVYATSAVSSTELTHVVAAYDPSSKTISIYINGALQGSSSFSSSFFTGTGDTYNRFCLGADIKTGDNGTDFPSSTMVIVDAKIYTTALNATQAALAYHKAKADLGF